MKRAIIAVSTLSAAALSACDPDPTGLRIVSRVPSPDGMREAIYAEDMSGGATVGPSEDIYIVAKGRLPRLKNRVFSEERVCHLRVRWLSNHAIGIGYSARDAKVERTTKIEGLTVYSKWLGRDLASGC